MSSNRCLVRIPSFGPIPTVKYPIAAHTCVSDRFTLATDIQSREICVGPVTTRRSRVRDLPGDGGPRTPSILLVHQSGGASSSTVGSRFQISADLRKLNSGNTAMAPSLRGQNQHHAAG